MEQIEEMSQQNSHAAIEPPKFEVIDQDEKYRVHSKTGILFVLRSMMRNKSLLACYFDHNSHSILTSVINVNAERDEIILDYGVDEESCQQALSAAKLNVIGFLDQVKIQFVCHGMRKVEFEKRDAFLARLPDVLLRIQKREYYRIHIPPGSSVKCVIPVTGGDHTCPAEVVLQDISCGGMAVINDRSNIDLETGVIYRDCLVTLPEIGTARVNLQIQDVSEMAGRAGLKRQSARCEFVDTQESMLSMVQRYINRLELEQKQERQNREL